MKTQELTVRNATEILPDKSITKEQAMFLLRSIWPKAPETEVVKAAILCKQYGLNPLMKQVFLIQYGNDWAIVMGIKASRQIAQMALRKRGIKYSYVDGPRAMSEEEQIKIFGQVDKTNFRAITVVKDSQGSVYPGYGKFPRDGKPYGMDKGNDIFNMAFIRSERNALDKMAPGELPDLEVGDDAYVEGDFKVSLEKGAQQFSDKVEKNIKELWPSEEPKALPAVTEAPKEATAEQKWSEEAPPAPTKPAERPHPVEPITPIDEQQRASGTIAADIGITDRLITPTEIKEIYALLGKNSMGIKELGAWMIEQEWPDLSKNLKGLTLTQLKAIKVAFEKGQ